MRMHSCHWVYFRVLFMHENSTNGKFLLHDALVNESGRIIFGSLLILAIVVVLSEFFSTRNSHNQRKFLYNVMISKHSTQSKLCVTDCKPLYTYYTHAHSHFGDIIHYRLIVNLKFAAAFSLSVCVSVSLARALSHSYELCAHIKSNVSDFP